MDARIVNRHVAAYGRIKIERAYCLKCKTTALIVDGKIQCCDGKVDASPERLRQKRIALVVGRRFLSTKNRNSILNQQDNRCLYCQHKFGTVVWRGKRSRVLRVEWDHLMPFCYDGNNAPANYAAACQICNRIKKAYVFKDTDEARIFILERWKKKGYSLDMPPLPGFVQPET